MQKFVSILGHKRKRIITDRYFKLIGSVVADYFESDPDNVDNPEASQIVGAPSDRQNQNDIAETRRKNIMSLCRTWLVSNLSPT